MPITVDVNGTIVTDAGQPGLRQGGVTIDRQIAQPSTAKVQLVYPPGTGFTAETDTLLLPTGDRLLLPTGDAILLPSGGGAGSTVDPFVPISIFWPTRSDLIFGGVVYEVDTRNAGGEGRVVTLHCQDYGIELERGYTRVPIIAASGASVASAVDLALVGWRGTRSGDAGVLLEDVAIPSFTSRRQAITSILTCGDRNIAAYATPDGNLQLVELETGSPVATIGEGDCSTWRAGPLLRTYRTSTIVLGTPSAPSGDVVQQPFELDAGLPDSGTLELLPWWRINAIGSDFVAMAELPDGTLETLAKANFSLTNDRYTLVWEHVSGSSYATAVRVIVIYDPQADTVGTARPVGLLSEVSDITIERVVTNEDADTQTSVDELAQAEQRQRSGADLPFTVEATVKPRTTLPAQTIGDTVRSELGATREMLVTAERLRFTNADRRIVQSVTLRRGDLAGDVAAA